MSKLPVGIFDSGLGGLTVLKEVLRCLPRENVVYFGDTARVPYGTKSRETVTRFSIENTRFLQGFDIKLLIVACHTASSLALEAVDRIFGFPVVGVCMPGAQRAAAVTENGRVGIIGTRSTITSGAYETAIRRLNPKIKTFGVACPLFVPLIEEGWTDGKVVRGVVEHYLKDLKSQGVDTVVLGCTHYPVLIDRLREAMPAHVRFVNPAEETASTVRFVLERERMCNSGGDDSAQIRYFVSDEPQQFCRLGGRFLGREISRVELVAEPLEGVTHEFD